MIAYWMQDSVQAHLRSFGAAIRGERRRLNLSQEDFAEICELHRTYIGQVERGEKNISFENITRIAHSLDLNPSELFSRARL